LKEEISMDTNYRYLLLTLTILCGLQITSYSQQLSTNIEFLSKGADVVLTGKVVQQNSSWNEDRSRIYTDATIQVEEYLKGNTNEGSIVVRYLGGEVGDVGELYTHMPRFEDDEEILVFLKRDQRTSSYKVYNGEEGKLSIVYDKNTGEKVTTSNVQINSLKAQIKNFIAE
jgi:hypothetical protein